MVLEDKYRKLIYDRHGKKLKTPVFQVSQSPFLYLTETEIRTAIKRAGVLFDDPEPIPNPYTIDEDSYGDIIISHPEEKNTVFLQEEADNELITDLLRKSEKEELNEGWGVEIGDSEPRASILAELFDAQRGEELKENPTLIIARDGTIHRKVRGKKAVPVCVGSYPDKKRGEQIKVTVENPETGRPEKGILKSYYCTKCNRRHFSGTRTFVTHFDHAGLTL